MIRVQPLVSVVIPTRNRSSILVRCLHALAEQTYKSYEVIVVDDASSDDTPDLLVRFASEHPELELRILRNEPQRGANPSRNLAIRESTGELIAFADDDCIADPRWLEELVAAFNSKDIGAACGRIDDPPPTNIFERAFRGTHQQFSRDGVHADRISSGNLCVRREILLEHMLDEDRATPRADISASGRGDETGLFLRLRASRCRIVIAPRAIVLHEHGYTGRAYFRQAYRSGGASARLGYKYHLRPPAELIPVFLCYITLPLACLRGFGWLLPAMFGAVFVVGIYHSERSRKCKTIAEALTTLPIVLAFYNVRLLGYVVQCLRLDKTRRTILHEPATQSSTPHMTAPDRIIPTSKTETQHDPGDRP